MFLAFAPEGTMSEKLLLRSLAAVAAGTLLAGTALADLVVTFTCDDTNAPQDALDNDYKAILEEVTAHYWTAPFQGLVSARSDGPDITQNIRVQWDSYPEHILAVGTPAWFLFGDGPFAWGDLFLNRDCPFFYDTTPLDDGSDRPSGTIDFVSVALHDVGHCIGIWGGSYPRTFGEPPPIGTDLDGDGDMIFPPRARLPGRKPSSMTKGISRTRRHSCTSIMTLLLAVCPATSSWRCWPRSTSSRRSPDPPPSPCRAWVRSDCWSVAGDVESDRFGRPTGVCCVRARARRDC